ncbi:MAG: MFS transporter [Chloroflexi bacterium]|nr:MFS transporter [Chloroflexota bacterium]
MKRPPLPSFIGDLVADRRAFGALLAGMVSLFAAGMDPKVMAPMATSTQAAIRARPEIEGLILLVSVMTAVLLLVGGAVGDTRRARPIIIGGLSVSLACGIAVLLLADPAGILFRVVRFAGIASAAMVMPAALAIAATSYTGIPRATAIGIAYAAYGAGQGLSPMLVALIPGTYAPAFIASIAASALALAVVRGRVPDLPRPTRAEKPVVYGTALWASGVVLISAGVLWLGAGWDDPLRLALVIGGILLVAVFFLWERRRRAVHAEAVRVNRRPVTIALFVGLVIAMAQIVPMSQLPLYFGVGMRYGPIFGIVALAPLFVALVAAGPIAGILLARYQPRHLIAGGVLAIGLGDILVAAVIGPTTTYLAFIIPLALVGGGFVVATTVRTAIIFSSVPRGMPATAAALNEASVEVGTRAGIVIATSLLAEVAIMVYTASLTGQPQVEIDGLVASFRDVLIVLGTPSLQTVAGAVPQADLEVYKTAYFVGVQVTMLVGGVVGVVGAVIAWITLGRHNPLRTVYEHRDERVTDDERLAAAG